MPQTVTLHPSRIGCPSIPGTMEGVVFSLKGVLEVNVRYEERALDVTFDPTVISAEDIIKAIGSELGLAMEVGTKRGVRHSYPEETCPI